MQDIIEQLADKICAAAGNKGSLFIRGGGTKNFYGERCTNLVNSASSGGVLDAAVYRGIVEYDPTELVVTARGGTRLTDLETELARHNQMLAFEPPHFGPDATLGGCVATGLSGPRRASAGGVRDFVLGVRMLDGRGQDLSFGGQVMKNVAGYDVSRLMTGSMGTLGLLLEVSLKVLPIPAMELTLGMPANEAQALDRMNSWAGKPLPVSATSFYEGHLYVRLSGAESAVRAARAKLGGEEIAEGSAFWESVREQTHAFFQACKPLWRLSVKSSAPPLSLPGKQFIEWGGALRWLVAEADGEAAYTAIRGAAKNAGGHATLFRGYGSCAVVFDPLTPGMMNISRRLKEKFDPMHVLNPGRMYPEI
ncbi:MAG: glycolate oxidase subunit GlcE [Nitrosospira sp.]|nr:glycolate oxidase subunit GlcE [Nitrosospira sp.]